MMLMNLQEYTERLKTLSQGPSEHKIPIKSIKYIVESMALFQNNFHILTDMYKKFKPDSFITPPHRSILFDLNTSIIITQEDMLNEISKNTAFSFSCDDVSNIDFRFNDLLQVLLFNQNKYYCAVNSIDHSKDDILEQCYECIDMVLTIVNIVYDIQYLFQKLVAIDCNYNIPDIELRGLP